MNEVLLQILLAIFLVALTLIYFYFRTLGKHRRRTILLTGVCDSGKTLIFSRLAHKTYVNTYTSIKDNTSSYLTEKGTVMALVDIPGHERLRNRYLDQHKFSVRGLVYVIDSLTIQLEIRDVAEYLYNLLIDETIIKHCKNILIFCNKQDNSTAKGAQILKSLLEKELNTVRETKSHSLESIEGKVDTGYLGNPGQEFEFSHCLPIVVEFAEGYALDSEGDKSQQNLEPLTKWITAIS